MILKNSAFIRQCAREVLSIFDGDAKQIQYFINSPIHNYPVAYLEIVDIY